MDKAVEHSNTKIVKAEAKGGGYIYTEVYKWFAETAGLGLAAGQEAHAPAKPIQQEEDLQDT